MSSFYGAGGNVTVNVSGGSGDSSISTLTGTSSSPIVLNSLDYGNYLIQGNYLYSSLDDTDKTASYQMLVAIIEDSTTSNKVAIFETCEDGIYYIYTIIFDQTDDTYLENKETFEGVEDTENIIFLSESDLPTEGVSNILYITETSIYQWSEDSQTYINLNSSPSWDEF